VRKRPRRAQSLGSAFVTACLVLGTAILAACNLLHEEARPPSVFDRVRAIDLLPRQPQPVESTADIGDNRRPVEYPTTSAPRVVTGAASDTSGQQFQSAASGEGYELNFENTPLANVAKVVLGDILGVGYTIDPRVQGTISLASGRPVSKSDILYILESALRVSNVALVRETAGYRLVPLAEAIGGGNVDRMAARPEPGYGVSVIPLQYVSAQTLIKLLDGFATKTGAVRADPGRNLLLIQGSGTERRAAVDTVLSFDADWMRGQSVGIFPIRNSTPEPIIAELEKVMDAGDGGMSQNVIKFQPVGRMSSILVVSRKPDLLRTAGTWISRLDRADSTTGVRVYRIRYGEARQMAKVLNDIFIGGGGSSNTLDQIGNQIAPGSGMSVTSSGDRGFDTSPAGQSGRNVRQQLGVAPPPAATLAPAPGATAPVDPPSGGGPPGSSGPVLQGVRITADVVNNTLLIYASQEHYRVIERTLRQIDRPQLQVAIDATVAEVTLNDQLSYGVQFFLTSKDLGLGVDKGSVLNTTARQPPTVDAAGVASAFLNRAFPGFNFLIGPENQPRAILDALHAVTNVKVLSNPSLVVIDNQPATLQVGDEVPISTGSATVLTTSNTIVNTIDYRNTGIILRVVPRVNVNGNVRLDIEQEISNVANTSTSATLTPTVSQRKVKSSIAVASGQTVLLAGLISERHNGDRAGIPVLDQIPGLGDVFSHRTKTINRTELIIFIRPQVIRDSVDAHVVAEELRSKLLGTIGVAPGGPVPPNVR
jgi:general secretion pathway protein D